MTSTEENPETGHLAQALRMKCQQRPCPLASSIAAFRNRGPVGCGAGGGGAKRQLSAGALVNAKERRKRRVSQRAPTKKNREHSGSHYAKKGHSSGNNGQQNSGQRNLEPKTGENEAQHRIRVQRIPTQTLSFSFLTRPSRTKNEQMALRWSPCS